MNSRDDFYMIFQKVLGVEHPFRFKHFMIGKSVVKDKENGTFRVVELDMKLEQSINISWTCHCCSSSSDAFIAGDG